MHICVEVQEDFNVVQFCCWKQSCREREVQLILGISFQNCFLSRVTKSQSLEENMCFTQYLVIDIIIEKKKVFLNQITSLSSKLYRW